MLDKKLLEKSGGSDDFEIDENTQLLVYKNTFEFANNNNEEEEDELYQDSDLVVKNKVSVKELKENIQAKFDKLIESKNENPLIDQFDRINEDQLKRMSLMNAEYEAKSIETKISTENSELKTLIPEKNDIDPEELMKEFQNIKVELPNTPYIGFTEESSFKRILVVTHNYIVTELINVIQKSKFVKTNPVEWIKNTSLTVIRIYCKVCGGSCNCLLDDSECKIELDFVVYNDCSHCDILN